MQQISKLSQQLKDLATSGSADADSQKQRELLQAEIKQLQAQLAQLEYKQAEEAQKKNDEKQSQSAVKPEGVNTPSDNNQIDIYI
jgi:50S ribosomal subunit-associated GTPase HflX